jgi:hypothetical protein
MGESFHKDGSDGCEQKLQPPLLTKLTPFYDGSDLRGSVVDCGSPLPLSGVRGYQKAPEDWRSPKHRGTPEHIYVCRIHRGSLLHHPTYNTSIGKNSL